VAEVHGFRTEFAEFRCRTETQIGFARWAGILAASTLVAVVGFGVKLVWDASKLDSRIAYQAERLDRIEKRLDRIETMQERTAVSIEALVKAMAAKTMAGVERSKPDN
jgi:hypothetical protein